MAETDPNGRYDLVVIGAGPGGYVAAIRAAQLGMSVACIEKEERLGGTCLRVGCIPSKALLESSELYHQAASGLAQHGIRAGEVSLDVAEMMKRKDAVVAELTGGIQQLFRKNKVKRHLGHGRLDGPGRVVVTGADGQQTELLAKHVLIATGSEVATLPGIEMDWDRIGGSTQALSYPEVPSHLVVIGAGVIGLELGSVWLRLGARVTVLEYLDRILPGVDAAQARRAHALFRRQGFQFRLGVRVTGARLDGDECVVELDGSEPVRADRVLVAAGRRPYTTGLGLESAGIETDETGRIPVRESFETKAAGIYAIGDVVAGPMLAHKAEEEGIACVERIATGYGHVSYDALPSVVYTDPELASAGRTEEQLGEAGIPFKSGKFLFSANGRAKALGRTDGEVKILAHAQTDRVLGVHMIGPRVSELVAEAVLAMELGASAEDIARVCHAHPTLAEAVREAALAVDGRAIHA